MANEYFLYTRPEGSTGWNYSGYQLKLSGHAQNNVVLHYREYDKSNPPSGGWNTVAGPGSGYSGNGTPDNPQSGDDLDLPASVGTVANLAGSGGYGSTGDYGAGYYPGDSPKEDESDWCAGSN